MTLRARIEEKLRAAFSPTHLEIFDDSADHKGHGAAGAHVRVVVVAEAFRGMSSLQRHRAVNGVFKDELATNDIHALQITARTPDEAPASA